MNRKVSSQHDILEKQYGTRIHKVSYGEGKKEVDERASHGMSDRL